MGRPRHTDTGKVEDGDRRCIVTGESKDRADMIRFVIAPDGTVTPDLDEKLPGRGIWVTATKAAIDTAVRDKKFAKAARAQVTVGEDLSVRLRALVKQRFLDTLALANRCGELAAGIDQVMAALSTGEAGLYVTASAKDSDARHKIERKNPDLPVIDCFADTELGRVIGRQSMSHMIVKSGNMCFKGVRLYRLYEQLGDEQLGGKA